MGHLSRKRFRSRPTIDTLEGRLLLTGPSDPGLSLASAVDMGTFNGNVVYGDTSSGTLNYSGTIGDIVGSNFRIIDRDRYLRFDLKAQATLRTSLNDLKGDADLELIDDRNKNGVVDAGEIIGA